MAQTLVEMLANVAAIATTLNTRENAVAKVGVNVSPELCISVAEFFATPRTDATEYLRHVDNYPEGKLSKEQRGKNRAILESVARQFCAITPAQYPVMFFGKFLPEGGKVARFASIRIDSVSEFEKAKSETLKYLTK